MTTAPQRPEVDDALVGALLDARYRVTGLIGRGGVATVYRATDTALGREVAVKVFRGAEGLDDPERRRSETALLASLAHPALVMLHDAVHEPTTGREFLVMELVEGPNLRERLDARGPLGASEAAVMTVELAEALHVIHARCIVHRDVKPANVLLAPSAVPTREWRAKLADFGIARLVDDAHLTITGGLIGTPGYLSPEQVRGQGAVAASDIYALGLLLLESRTGRAAFPGPALEAASARLTRDPELPPFLAPDWRELITAMVARNPADRPTALDVAVAAATLGPDLEVDGELRASGAAVGGAAVGGAAAGGAVGGAAGEADVAATGSTDGQADDTAAAARPSADSVVDEPTVATDVAALASDDLRATSVLSAPAPVAQSGGGGAASGTSAAAAMGAGAGTVGAGTVGAGTAGARTGGAGTGGAGTGGAAAAPGTGGGGADETAMLEAGFADERGEAPTMLLESSTGHLRATSGTSAPAQMAQNARDGAVGVAAGAGGASGRAHTGGTGGTSGTTGVGGAGGTDGTRDAGRPGRTNGAGAAVAAVRFLRRRCVIPAGAVAVLAVVMAIVLPMLLSGSGDGGAEPTPAPIPSVPGELGVHLDELEEAVTP